MNTNLHIVITGASGFIGQALLTYFQKKGYTLTALVRTIPTKKLANINYVIYDMAKEIDNAVSFYNAIVIHCAYSKQKKTHEPELNEIAAQHLLKKIKLEKAKYCIFFSSFSATSGSGSYYSLQKNKLEKLFQFENAACVRPGLVVGNGGLFESTVQFIKRFRLLPLIGGGSQLVYYVGINDVTKAVHELVLQLRNGCYYLNYATPLSYKTFYKTVAKKINTPLVLVPVPLWLLKPLLYLYSYLPNAAITKDNINGLNHVPTPDAIIMKQSVFSFAFEDLHHIDI